MIDVEELLTSLGLSEYAGAFAENAIDGDVLADLTDADLKDLGVHALGHRKKILKAVAGLKQRAGSAEGRDLNVRAQRRQLTLMFADLADFDPAVPEHGSGGLSRPHSRLSGHGQADHRTRGRVCREVSGRWGARLFRLPAVPRGRRRACDPRRTGLDRCALETCAGRWGTGAQGPDWRGDRPGRGRRHYRRGRFTRACGGG